MTVPYKTLVDTIRSKVEELESAYPRYHEDVLDTLVGILMAEREHKQQQTQIQKKVSAKCQDLGTLLVSNGWTS